MTRQKSETAVHDVQGVQEDPERVELATRFAVTAAELARALGISERLVRDHQAEFPHLWIGNRVLFPVDGVREWLRKRAEATQGAADSLADEILKEMTGT